MNHHVTIPASSWQAGIRDDSLENWQALSFDKAENTYTHTLETWLKDSNAYANTYFSRYFEWQGMCRESWFFKCISADMLQDQGVFITKLAHNDYVNETFPFQKIRCEMNSALVKQASFYLVFRFYNAETGDLVSGGYQQIVFANHQRRISRLPASILAKIRAYEVPLDSTREGARVMETTAHETRSL